MLKNNITDKIDLIFLSSLLIFIGLIGPMTIDMYVPSLPYIAKSFAVSNIAVKYTITIFLISYSLGQLIYGPLIDSFGRKRILLTAVIIGLLGSVLCFIAPSITILYLGRFLQGAGYSGISVAALVIARDVLNDKHFAQISSILSLIFGLGPICSPIIGGYIDYLFGWRTVFEFITIYTVLVLLLIFLLVPETHEKTNRTIFKLKNIITTWQFIFSNKVFIRNTFSKSIAYTGFIVFYTVTPFMLQNHLGLNSIQYGWVTLALTGAILLAKLCNTFMLNRVSIEKINFASICLLAFASCLLLLLALLGFYSITAILIPFMIFGLGSGFLFTNATVAAFKPFKNLSSGSVSGLLNGLQLLSAFIGSAIAAHLGLKSLLPLGIFMSILGVLALVQFVLVQGD